MTIPKKEERRLLIRLRYVSFLLLFFSFSFLGYSYISKDLTPVSPSLLMAPVETSGLDILTLEEALPSDTPPQQIFLLGSLFFCLIGISLWIFSTQKLKKL